MRLSVTGLLQVEFGGGGGGVVYWLFDVTVDDITVIFLMAHIFTGGLKRLVLVLGLQKLFGS